MKFRPCIDIHNGVVKQIVGSTLTENSADTPVENFISSKSAGEFASMYKTDNLYGGHVILLGPNCEEAALEAVSTFPAGLQIGGGITADNAHKYLEAGASHIIVTSYVFKDGQIDFDRLSQLSASVGKERLVLDLSCRKRSSEEGGPYYVVTNKWTQYTDFAVTPANLVVLAEYCDEFLVHGVDVEGKRCGIEEELVALLGNHSPLSVTYAGGVRSIEDLELVRRLGSDKVDCTVGSALDVFGGELPYAEVVAWHNSMNI